MAIDLKQYALNMISSMPAASNIPFAQAGIDAIRTGNAVNGEEIARNICNSMGITPENAFEQARSFFHI